MPAQSGTHREFHPFSLGRAALAPDYGSTGIGVEWVAPLARFESVPLIHELNRVDQRVNDRCNRGGTTPRRPDENTDGRVNRHNPARPTPRAVTPRAGV